MRRKSSSQDTLEFQLDLTKEAPIGKRDSLGLPISDPLEYSDDQSCNQTILREIREEERLEEERAIEKMKESMHSQQSSQSSSSRCTANSEDRKRERRAIFEKYKKQEEPATRPEQTEKDLLLAFDNIFKKKEQVVAKRDGLDTETHIRAPLVRKEPQAQPMNARKAPTVTTNVGMNVSDSSLIVMDGNNYDQLADALKSLPQNGLKDSIESNDMKESIEMRRVDSYDMPGGRTSVEVLNNDQNMVRSGKFGREDSLLGGGFSKIYPMERNASIISYKESHDLEDLLKQNIFSDVSQLDINRSGSIQLKDSYRNIHTSALKGQNQPQILLPQIESQGEIGSGPLQELKIERQVQPSSSTNLSQQSLGKQISQAYSPKKPNKLQANTTQSTALAFARLMQPPGLQLSVSPFPFPEILEPAAVQKVMPALAYEQPLVVQSNHAFHQPTNRPIEKPHIDTHIPVTEIQSPVRTPIRKMEDLIASPTPISHRKDLIQSAPDIQEATLQTLQPEFLREAFRLNATSVNLSHPKIHLLAPKLRAQLTKLVTELTLGCATLMTFNQELLRRETVQTQLRSSFKASVFLQGAWTVPLTQSISLIKPSVPFERRVCDHINIQSNLGEFVHVLPQLQVIINDNAKLDLLSPESKSTYIAVRSSLNEMIKFEQMISEDLYMKAFVQFVPEHYVTFYQYLKTQAFSQGSNLKLTIRQKESMRVLVNFMRESGDPLCCSTVGRDIKLKLERELKRLRREYYQNKTHPTLA